MDKEDKHELVKDHCSRDKEHRSFACDRLAMAKYEKRKTVDAMESEIDELEDELHEAKRIYKNQLDIIDEEIERIEDEIFDEKIKSPDWED